MRKTTIATAVAILLVSVIGTALASAWYFGQQEFADGVIVSSMHSAVLGQERPVIVHPPESYAVDSARRYPVMYVLDGSSQDIHTASSAALMARLGLMPELIVVGLPNVSGAGRQRDYTPPFMVQDIDDPKSLMGRADRFLAFLKTELIPDIDRQYRTTSDRVLAGHSRGGLLVAYSLLAEPELFQARFAHSPALWRDNTIMATKLTEHLAYQALPDSFFYMSLGSEENEQMTAAFERFRMVLDGDAPSSLRWKADTVAGANHGNNGERATPLGFRAFYRDWRGEAIR